MTERGNGKAAGAANGLEPERIGPAALREALDRGERVAVIDVRRRESWMVEPERIPGAAWLPLAEIDRRAGDLPRDAHFFIYCS